MGREVRRVPADWVHPGDGEIPLLDGETYENDVEDWERECRLYKEGTDTYEPGDRPERDRYMLPGLPDEQRTHLQMYETCTEGTPISPVFATPEEVARWCADNGASAFAGQTASYEAWLRIAKGGYAPSAIITIGGPLISGVEAFKDDDVASTE